MPDHLMNPYWFIPMDKDQAPPTLTLAQWGVVPPRPDLLTGRIRLRVEVLTPLHVGGGIDTSTNGPLRPTYRHFYKRRRDGGDQPVVDGSTLRGCVRSYLEALTNGVAGAYVTEHPKQQGERHIGFWVGHPPGPGASQARRARFTERIDDLRPVFGDRGAPQAVSYPPHAFKPDSLGPRADDGDVSQIAVDPVTLLFGLVTTEARDGHGSREAHGLAGRVRFEDAWFTTSDLTNTTSLDIEGKASFGAPKIRRNWWYFKPQSIRRRHVRVPAIHGPVVNQSAEFVGGHLRGRKAYFHQDPARCVAWYKRHWVQPGAGQTALIDVPTEVVAAGKASEPFYVHFHDLPEPLLRLLIAGLSPTRMVRHKLGALRAFGFGSVRLVVDAVEVRAKGVDALDLTQPAWVERRDLTLAADGKQRDGADMERASVPEATLTFPTPDGGAPLTSPAAWARLRLIQGFPKDLSTWPTFAYPPYRQGVAAGLERGFANVLSANYVLGDHRDVAETAAEGETRLALDFISRNKAAVDIDYWQTTSPDYQRVAARAGLPTSTLPAK